MSENEKYSFWFSEKHANHYARLNQVFVGERDKCPKNAAQLDRETIIYTTCTTREGATEPYEGALKSFPDYLKVAEGELGNIINLGIW